MADNNITGDHEVGSVVTGNVDGAANQLIKKKRRRRRKPSKRVIDETTKITEEKFKGTQVDAVIFDENGVGSRDGAVAAGGGGEVVVKKKKRRRRKKKTVSESVPAALPEDSKVKAVPLITDEQPEHDADVDSAVSPEINQPVERDLVVESHNGDAIEEESLDQNYGLEQSIDEEHGVELSSLEEQSEEDDYVPNADIPDAEALVEPVLESVAEPIVEPVEEPSDAPEIVYNYEETPRGEENIQVFPLAEALTEDLTEQEGNADEDKLEDAYFEKQPQKTEERASWAELMERSKNLYEQENRENPPEQVEQSEQVEQPEQVEPSINEQSSANINEPLVEKKSLADIVVSVLKLAGSIFVAVFNLRMILWLVVSVGLIWGGFWAYGQKYHEYIINIFFGKDDIPGIVLELTDPAVLIENGIEGALVFGANTGTFKDLIPEEIWIAGFFGTLSEPKDTGETGISAATYFGQLMDERAIVNLFVEFVDVLSRMQNLFSVDVYDLLDRTTARETALIKYLDDLNNVRDEARVKYTVLKTNIDELKVSYNSLGPDKDKFETDFFVSLDRLEAEKSDYLLKAFVDASQKQVALKARVAALEKLAEYFDNAFSRLERRISAVDQNSEALVRGIRVVDVPGAGIDMIIRAETQ